MKTLFGLITISAALFGCSTFNVTVPPSAAGGSGGSVNITINGNRIVTTSPSVSAQADGNTVPVSALP